MKNSLVSLVSAHHTQIIPLENPWIPDEALMSLLQVISSLGGYGLLVGGCVRDHLLGLKPKDIDIEVYGLNPEELEVGLKKYFQVMPVGISFGVFKVLVNNQHGSHVFDVSLPRQDNNECSRTPGFCHKP